MKSPAFRLLSWLLLAFFISGCASTDAMVEGGRSLKQTKRFFVVSNLNDNRAVDRQIATALQARGRTVETGPLTMMPDDTQAVVTFTDHWTWDFGEHLVYLKISVRDPLATQPYAEVNFSARVPLREKPNVTIDRLVGALLEK